MKTFLAAAAFVLFGFTASVVFAADALRNIDITEKAAVADAAAVSDLVAGMTKEVTECAQTNEPPAECQCKFPDTMGKLKTSYDDAVKKHPDWKGAVVNYRAEGASEGASVSFAGVEEQLKVCK